MLRSAKETSTNAIKFLKHCKYDKKSKYEKSKYEKSKYEKSKYEKIRALPATSAALEKINAKNLKRLKAVIEKNNKTGKIRGYFRRAVF